MCVCLCVQLAKLFGSIRGNKTLQSLNITGCFGRKTEQRKMMIGSLKLGIEESSVVELNMSAGSSPLREELRGFLLAMISNKTIKYLNISLIIKKLVVFPYLIYAILTTFREQTIS